MKKIINLLTILVLLFVISGCSKNHKVTIDYDNEKAVEIINVKDGERVSRPADPHKDGYEFDKWLHEGKEYDFNKPVNSDITIKANYLKQYKVTLNPNNGQDKTICIITHGHCIDEPVKPNQEGYHFVQWEVDGQKYDFTSKVEKDFEIVAKWEKTIEVESLSFKTNSIKLKRGQVINLPVTINPGNAEENEISYSSSNNDIVTIDSNGNIKAVNKGKATVIAVSKNGKSAICEVNVYVAVESIVLKSTRDTIAYNGIL